MTTLWQALSTALADIAGSVLVVGGRDPGVAAAFRAASPEGYVVCPGRAARLATAAGAALGAMPVVALVDGPVSEPWDLGGSLVAVTRCRDAAASAHRAGIAVWTPAWRREVAPLLRAACRSGEPCLMLLHDLPAPAGSRPLGDAAADEPRVLRLGDEAVVVAAGGLALALRARAAELPAGVAAVALACLPRLGLDPVQAGAGVLVGERATFGDFARVPADLSGLRWVAVRDPADIAQALAPALAAASAT